ncbi:DnaJ domain [Musa troglodytarum]|uniref:DnaJ domain n=1 Tax=Musa troglodytarum TaxID=320322 RepID=A0A9E7JPL4_9LILI|nr:DnaJ domain [Musa troglodytarum]
MDDFPGILVRDFGFRPQGKSAPMATSSGGGSANLGFGSGRSSGANGSWGNSRSGWNSNSAGDAWIGVGGSESRNSLAYDDVFGGPTGAVGVSSSSFEYDDVFSSISSGPNRVSSSPFEDLLENLGKPMPESKKGASDGRSAEEKDRDLSDFDDLIPGFGGAVLPRKLPKF